MSRFTKEMVLDYADKLLIGLSDEEANMVLEEFANILRSYSIRGIVSGRWGGEEFIMIAPYDIKYEQFVNILERLRIKVSKSKLKIDDNSEISITISIGVSKVDTYNILEDGVKKADINLYEAKNKGRNMVIS